MVHQPFWLGVTAHHGGIDHVKSNLFVLNVVAQAVALPTTSGSATY
jgi:hypothetical protein